MSRLGPVTFTCGKSCPIPPQPLALAFQMLRVSCLSPRLSVPEAAQPPLRLWGRKARLGRAAAPLCSLCPRLPSSGSGCPSHPVAALHCPAVTESCWPSPRSWGHFSHIRALRGKKQVSWRTSSSMKRREALPREAQRPFQNPVLTLEGPEPSSSVCNHVNRRLHPSME